MQGVGRQKARCIINYVYPIRKLDATILLFDSREYERSKLYSDGIFMFVIAAIQNIFLVYSSYDCGADNVIN